MGQSRRFALYPFHRRSFRKRFRVGGQNRRDTKIKKQPQFPLAGVTLEGAEQDGAYKEKYRACRDKRQKVRRIAAPPASRQHSGDVSHDVLLWLSRSIGAFDSSARLRQILSEHAEKLMRRHCALPVDELWITLSGLYPEPKN